MEPLIITPETLAEAGAIKFDAQTLALAVADCVLDRLVAIGSKDASLLRVVCIAVAAETVANHMVHNKPTIDNIREETCIRLNELLDTFQQAEKNRKDREAAAAAAGNGGNGKGGADG